MLRCLNPAWVLCKKLCVGEIVESEVQLDSEEEGTETMEISVEEVTEEIETVEVEALVLVSFV